MPAPLFIDDRVAKAVERGAVTPERIDDAVLRLIRQQLRFAPSRRRRLRPRGDRLRRRTARSLARWPPRAIVLLRNEPVDGRPVLPLRGARAGAPAPGGEAAAGAPCRRRLSGASPSSAAWPPCPTPATTVRAT